MSKKKTKKVTRPYGCKASQAEATSSQANASASSSQAEAVHDSE